MEAADEAPGTLKVSVPKTAANGLTRAQFQRLRSVERPAVLEALSAASTKRVVGLIAGTDVLMPQMAGLSKVVENLTRTTSTFDTAAQSIRRTFADSIPHATVAASRLSWVSESLAAQELASTRAMAAAAAMDVPSYRSGVSSALLGLAKMEDGLRPTAQWMNTVDTTGIVAMLEGLGKTKFTQESLQTPRNLVELQSPSWAMPDLASFHARWESPMQRWLNDVASTYAVFATDPGQTTGIRDALRAMGNHGSAASAAVRALNDFPHLEAPSIPSQPTRPVLTREDAMATAAVHDLLPGHREMPLAESRGGGPAGVLGEALDSQDEVSRLQALYPALARAGFRLLKVAGTSGSFLAVSVCAQYIFEREAPGVYAHFDEFLSRFQVALFIAGILMGIHSTRSSGKDH